ncbi:hypothetical protein CpecA_0749 [Chlamydia pecorum IPTaLE]|uniref:CT214 family putative inclusion membrane protein n=1 Tax=Chlamydia pecorum TaxID=85991 RepID=UPI0003D3DD0D|nr:hypothetical protein [Chlamydia pecorum]ETF40299.1 hypothetical protein CpecA_0749 [Chlamydia pecorum IPTaLE]
MFQEVYPKTSPYSNLSPDQQQIVNSIRGYHKLALIAGVAAAALLLITAVLLYCIPAFPVAVGALGVAAVIFLGVSVGLWVCRARAFNRLMEDFKNSIDLIKIGKPSEHLSIRKYPRKSKTLDHSSFREGVEGPYTPSPGDDPNLEFSSSDSGEEAGEFVAPSLRLRQFLLEENPPVVSSAFYKDCQSKIKKCLASLYQSVGHLIDTMNRGENKETLVKKLIIGIFNPFSGQDNLISSVITMGTTLFTDSTYGVTWFHDAIHTPGKILPPLMQLIEKFFKEKEKPSAGVLNRILMSINLVLSGWVLGDPKLLCYVVGSVKQLNLSQEATKQVIRLLEKGNIIGALIMTCGSSYPAFEKMLVALRTEEGSQDVSQGARFSIDELTPKNFRKDIASADIEEDQHDIEQFASKLQEQIKQVEDALPNSRLRLIASLAKGAPEIRKALEQFLNFLSENPPKTLPMSLTFLPILKKSMHLQKVLRTYLPKKVVVALTNILSIAMQGGIISRVFTSGHYKKLADSLNITVDELIALIETKKCLQFFLPELIK